MTYRTDDLSYGEQYWQTLDGGAGYNDSVMWADIAHAVWEVLVPDRAANLDRSGEHRCLDIGCAFGFFVRHMHRRGVETFGVDYSQYALDHAPADVAGKLQWHDLTTPGRTFYGGGFSIVCCFETLEHIPEVSVPTALACIHDSLAPTGHGVLTICTDKQPGWESDPTHVTVKSRAWWSQMLRRAHLHECPALTADLRRFWLFGPHDGVFVVRQSWGNQWASQA
jgi:2-polyprenyl-3-methyl-5-hydroxy-6-metoxy-1,4-benzoquinol methylase